MSLSPSEVPKPESTAKRPGDDFLPPVQPPTAGFILQLFLIPMLIVSVIVGVWLMFTWLAHMGSNPRELAAELRTPNEAGWQKAMALAEHLGNPGSDSLKDDVDLANDLVGVLDSQLTDGLTDEKSILMRVFICRALGEFRVPEVVPALLRAASTERDDAELKVRDAALQGLAVAAANLSKKYGPEMVRSNELLLQTLDTAASEPSSSQDGTNQRAELRSAAAFALGVVGGPTAIEKLVRMLDDAYPNARYNAATGLARHGDPRATPVLIEMLDPSSTQAVSGETSDSERAHKRSLVIMNGIRASAQLGSVSPQSDLAEVRAALVSIQESELPKVLRVAATEALSQFD